MMDKQYSVFLGNYGSGKTEIALNTAVMQAQTHSRVALVDLDIVNPYFRSAEKKEILQKNGIRLIASKYVNTAIDLPLIPPEVHSVFSGADERAVFDVGGDAVGATALGTFREPFSRVRNRMGVYYVVNVRRPLSSTLERILDMMNTIQEASRLRLDGLINNSNLGVETTEEDLLEGQSILRKVSAKTGIPIAYTSGMPDILEKAASVAELDGEAFFLTRYMELEWQAME